jgi:hypothetical protein
MELRSEDQQIAVRLTVVETETERYPSVALAVQLLGRHISADGVTVWIDEAGIGTFIGQLRELDRTRRGKAVLSGMSPGAFELALEAVGSRGHLIASVSVSKVVSVGDPPVARNESATIQFDLDPTMIPSLVHECKGLAAAIS